jgi:hypothetical protein
MKSRRVSALGFIAFTHQTSRNAIQFLKRDMDDNDSDQKSERFSLHGMTPEEAIQKMFGVTQRPAKPAYREAALAFANSLASGNFNGAYKMLTPELQTEFPPSKLKDRYDQMIAYAGSTCATAVELGWAFEGLPEDADECTAYVTISGPHEMGGSWGEAVTVIFESQGGQPLIRWIDWGRP